MSVADFIKKHPASDTAVALAPCIEQALAASANPLHNEGATPTCLVAQRVTGKHKVVSRFIGPYLVKGPYPAKSQAPTIVLYRSQRFRAWGAGDCVPPVSLQTRALDGCRFLVYPRAGRLPSRAQLVVYYKWADAKASPPLQPGVGWVACRSADDDVVQLSSLVKTGAELDTDTLHAFFRGMLLRFVLDCGDSGPWNVLVESGGVAGAKKQVWVIDFEDKRGAKSRRDSVWGAMMPNRSVVKREAPRIQAALVTLAPVLATWLQRQLEVAEASSCPPNPRERDNWHHLMQLFAHGKLI